MSLPDLSTVTTDELVEELGNRYDHMIIAGIKEMTTRPSNGGQPKNPSLFRLLRFKGNRDTCVGLGGRVQFVVMQESQSNEQPASDEEDRAAAGD